MNYSLKEAAHAMGKSVRQLRYLIQKGALPARKVKGQWAIPKETVALSSGQKRAGDQKQQRAREVVEEVFRPKDKSKPYSVTDLRAFETARSIYREIHREMGDDHPVTALILEALMQLGCGCHAYHSRQKAACFSLAREKACRAAVRLLVNAKPMEDLGLRIERELIPAISGLIRRVESRKL